MIHSDYYNPEAGADSSALLFPLQGGGFGEPTHGQPHGPEQPLHPGRSREQLLSLHTYGTVPGRKGLGTPDFDLKLCVTGRRLVSKRVFFFVTDGGIDWSEIETEERLISSLITSSALVWNGAVRATDGGTHRISRCFSAFFLLSHSSVLWTESQTSYSRYYRQKCHETTQGICDCISKQREIIVLLSGMCLIISAGYKPFFFFFFTSPVVKTNRSKQKPQSIVGYLSNIY